VHNILPRPWNILKEKANGEFVSLSSPEDDDRRSAIKYTRGSMDWAERFEAKAMVLHLGKVSMDGVMEGLMKIYDQGRIRSEEGKAFIEENKKIRARLGKPLLEASLKSLEKLAKEAEKRGILLGIENRYNIQDFPGLEEFKTIFREFKGSPIHYWHDIGHATTQENLGLVEKGKLLENFGELLTGIHLHGCKGYNDHYAPGGEEDYIFLKEFLKPETVRIVETHHRATRQDLIRGIEFLREQGFS
jgi:sugar phosphate isomerase/epimerase